MRRNVEHVAGLTRADLDENHPLRREKRRGRRKDRAISVESVDPAVERKARIEMTDSRAKGRRCRRYGM